jgi:hypothetical protein
MRMYATRAIFLVGFALFVTALPSCNCNSINIATSEPWTLTWPVPYDGCAYEGMNALS